MRAFVFCEEKSKALCVKAKGFFGVFLDFRNYFSNAQGVSFVSSTT